jgi:hypothetical protein
VGCTLEKYDHKSYEVELGIHIQLAGLEDAIFEGLPNDLAMQWPEQFLQAITPGADLSKVWHKFAVWLLIDPIDGVFKFSNHESIRHVAELHTRAVVGDMPSIGAWAAAETAAWAAAETAAWAAAGAAAGDAARDAAWAAAGDAARDAAYSKQSEKLLELLRDAK